MAYNIIHNWYNMDSDTVFGADQHDVICVVQTENLAKEVKAYLTKNLKYTQNNNLIEFNNNYDGRNESIYYKEIDDIVIYNDIAKIKQEVDLPGQLKDKLCKIKNMD